MQTSPPSLIDVIVSEIQDIARDIKLFELRSPVGAGLPTFDPGAHLDVHLPDSLVRQYSLVIAEPDARRYTIAVKRETAGRGGSMAMHDTIRAGDPLKVSTPRNHFPLHQTPEPAVLIAGGIGITPVWCMARWLVERSRPWSLHYACRTREDAAFHVALSKYTEAHLHIDKDNDGRFLDVARIVADAPESAHLYCCGPAPMLHAFEQATAGRDPARVHVEHFSAKHEAARSGGFIVELARSGRSFFIAGGRTILEVLLEAGLDLPFSCEQGVCGTCETRILSGVPEHRDSVLSKEEQASNATAMICCAGCKGERLVLDL